MVSHLETNKKDIKEKSQSPPKNITAETQYTVPFGAARTYIDKSGSTPSKLE